jgi:hypothetical protein
MAIRSIPDLIKQELVARERYVEELRTERDAAKVALDAAALRFQAAKDELVLFKDDIKLLPARLWSAQ